MSQSQRTQSRMKVLLSLLICQCFTSLFAEFSTKEAAAHSNGAVYIKMPVNMSEALSQGWMKAEVNDYETVLSMPDNPRVGVIFGKDGIVVGMKVAVTSSNPVAGNSESISDEQNSKVLLFVNPDVIQGGGRGPLNGSVMSELWQRKGKAMVNIPIKASELVGRPGSGRRDRNPRANEPYNLYHNMTEMKCCQDLQPWFIAVNNDTREMTSASFMRLGNSYRPTN